jgi:hypothetical protein
MASVTFSRNPDGIPAPWRDLVESSLSEILLARPSTEAWSITHREPSDGHSWEFDCACGEVSATLVLLQEQMDSASEAFFTAFQSFVHENWGK